MPSYLGRVEVDWGWQKLDERERGLARLAEARLQADAHSITHELLVDTLTEASRQLAGRELRARFIPPADADSDDDRDSDRAGGSDRDGGSHRDSAGVVALLVARDGRCQPGDAARFDEGGTFTGTLGADD